MVVVFLRKLLIMKKLSDTRSSARANATKDVLCGFTTIKQVLEVISNNIDQNYSNKTYGLVSQMNKLEPGIMTITSASLQSSILVYRNAENGYGWYDCSTKNEALEIQYYKFLIESCFPILEIALRIYLSLVITSSSSEYSFSALKRIKNELRNIIKQERLNYFALMNTEYDLLREIDTSSIFSRA